MTPTLTISETKLNGLKVVQRRKLIDERGFFARIFCRLELENLLGDSQIIQANFSETTKTGTIRGLHCQQPPYAEKKIVICVKGSVHDVVVDLRCKSSTRFENFNQILSAENCKALVIPEGFAHGFQSLEKDCQLIYLHTAPYNKDAEIKFNVFDPVFKIHWPLKKFHISAQDRDAKFVDEQFKGLNL